MTAGVVVLFMGGVAYLALNSQRLSAQLAHFMNGQKAAITVVVPTHSASGVMQGARWRVVPGGFGGGFGTSSNERRETY